MFRTSAFLLLQNEVWLFLQFKEAQPSVLAPYLKGPTFQNQGFRVVSGQRLIQGSPDILLGWGKVQKTEFYIRQLRDMKGSFEFDPENPFDSRSDLGRIEEFRVRPREPV